jgi:hypothetical protein
MVAGGQRKRHLVRRAAQTKAQIHPAMIPKSGD